MAHRLLSRWVRAPFLRAGARFKELTLLPSATHPESTPFLLVRDASHPADRGSGEHEVEEEDFDTQVDARKAVKARRPPARANVKVDDLPSVIVEENAAPAGSRRSSEKVLPSVVVDVDDDWQRRSHPTLVLDRAQTLPPRSMTARAGRIVVAGLVLAGAACAAGSALGIIDLHSVHASVPHMPRAIASLIHR